MKPLTLGQRIKLYRKKVGISQKKLADAVGVSNTTISHYEVDFRVPGIARLKKLAKILKVTPAVLSGMDLSDEAPKGNEWDLLRAFRSLNDIWQDRVLDYVSSLSNIPQYTNTSVDG